MEPWSSLSWETLESQYKVDDSFTFELARPRT